MTNNKAIKILPVFRMIAIAEGISFLILLFIAMPLKYYADIPEVVRYFGWAHGLLFVLYLGLAFELGAQLNKGFIWLVIAFFASVMPFGTFIFDRQFHKKEA
jgi:integral membrane protein